VLANSHDIDAKGIILIPELILPKGSEEAALLWQTYMDDCFSAAADAETPRAVAHVIPETGDVILVSENGEELTAPTETLG